MPLPEQFLLVWKVSACLVKFLTFQESCYLAFANPKRNQFLKQEFEFLLLILEFPSVTSFLRLFQALNILSSQI